jgi:TetR/AcrR family transcriptional repressor of nem operon
MVRYPAAETAEKHERILSEASRLFRERGLSGVSVGDLMKASDLTHGSFYNHFDSKQSLIAACIAHVVNSPPQVPTAKAFCRRTAF